jgi:hypothetical protein
MLIGLTGRAGAGKDTVYETLAELYGDELPVERRSFAALLYESAAAALGVTVDDLDRWKRDPEVVISVYDPRHGMMHEQTVRSHLQRYGTEAHHDVFGHDFWVDALNLRGHRGRIVAVTDVRFPNEAVAIIAAGGAVARVLGPTDGPARHPSEEPIPDEVVDYTISNVVRNDDRVCLRRRVRALVTAIRHSGGEMP